MAPKLKSNNLSSFLDTMYHPFQDKALALLCALGGFVLVSQYAFAAEERSLSAVAVQAPAQFDTIKSEIRARVTKGEFPSSRSASSKAIQ
jgi:hypothetical protein